jgi:hypothetical protein
LGNKCISIYRHRKNNNNYTDTQSLWIIIKTTKTDSMDKNEKLLKLLRDYKGSLEGLSRDDVFKLSSTVDSIITRSFPADLAYKRDLDYLRKNLGIMITLKNDKGYMGQDLVSIKKIFLGLLDSMIDEISAVGLPIKDAHKNSLVNVSVMQNQSQEQKQSQEQLLTVFFDSIKDEISGKQLKELKEIAKNEPDPERAKPKIIEKIKSFGSDVCSNIIANIVTNPAIWTGLF